YQLPAYRSASCINETSLCNSYTLSLHDALPIFPEGNVEIAVVIERDVAREAFRKLTDHFHFAGENVLRADGGADNERVVGDVERSEEHTSELQSRENLVCRLLLEKKNKCNTRIN